MSPLYPDMRKVSAPLSITSGRCYMMPSKWPKSSEESIKHPRVRLLVDLTPHLWGQHGVHGGPVALIQCCGQAIHYPLGEIRQ